MRSAVIAAAVLLLGAGWPTASHDARRTGQSDVRGPRSAERTASVVLTAEQNINMAVTIAGDGTVYAGTWGVVRSGGSSDVASWNKFDGKLFAFHRSLEPRVEFAVAAPDIQPSARAASSATVPSTVPL